MTATDETTHIPKHLAELSQDAPGQHSISEIRKLTPDEVAEIERADGLVIKAGNAASWQRCHRLFGSVMNAIAGLQESDPPGPGEIERVRSGFSSLRTALEELAKELDGVVQDVAAPDEKLTFTETLEAVRNGSSWRHAFEIADVRAGSFKAAPTGQLVWQRRSDQEVLDPVAVAAEAIQDGQDLLTREYLAIGPALTEAAQLLLRLRAEAPGGAPAIVELTIEGDTPTQVKPQLLALDRIAPAMRATRLASLIAEQEEEEAGAHAGLEEEADASALRRTDETIVESLSAESPEEESSDVELDQDEATLQEPIELSSLFRLARTLDSDLEKVWSAALEETLVEPATEKQLAAVIGLVTALQRKLAAQSQELKRAGADTRVEEWPLSIERLAALDPPAGVEERREQSGLAQLNAFLDVMETLKGLQRPANITVSFNQEGESVERFWSAGAFALLRDRLSLLERLTREHDGYVAEITRQEGEEVERTPNSSSFHAFDRISLGSRALMHGDPESAVFHGLLAIAFFLNVSMDQIATKLADDSADPAGLSEEEKKIISLASEGLTRLLAAEPDLSMATLLAEATLRVAYKLTIGPVGGSDLSSDELAELIESRQPLQPLEQEDNGGDT